MRFHLFLSLIYICLLQSGCNDQQQKDDKAFALLQGEWITENQGSFLSFQDSLLISHFNPSIHMRFRVRNDTLYTWHYDRRNPKTGVKLFRYAILELSADTLKIRATKPQANGEAIESTTFKKMLRKHTIVPEAIAFYSGNCYGPCPSLNLEINSNGNFKYFGRSFVSRKGGFRGKLSQKQQSILLRMIRQTELDSLKEEYNPYVIDAQVHAIGFLRDGK